MWYLWQRADVIKQKRKLRMTRLLSEPVSYTHLDVYKRQPVIIDDTADVKMAVNSIIHSKTFDNGMICASEQMCIRDSNCLAHRHHRGDCM